MGALPRPANAWASIRRLIRRSPNRKALEAPLPASCHRTGLQLASTSTLLCFLLVCGLPAVLGQPIWPWAGFDSNHSGRSPYAGPISAQPVLKLSINAMGKVTSPAIGYDGSIIAASADSNVYSLNVGTGAYNWKYTTGNSITGSVVISPDNCINIGACGCLIRPSACRCCSRLAVSPLFVIAM